jgi:hypothetical protein
MTPDKIRIAYQGEPGANSHIACLEVYPDAEPVAWRPSRRRSPRWPPAR